MKRTSLLLTYKSMLNYRKTILLIVCLLAYLVSLKAANVKTVELYFNKDSYTVTAAEGAKLSALKNADVITLAGHTDNDGADGYNMELSAKRVAEVKRIIGAMNPGARIESEYFGESKPVNENNGEAEKSRNRRVQISYIVDPLLKNRVQQQFFEIDNARQQVIHCKEGTEITIPAGAFADKHTLIKVSEYYDPLEIFSANLSTTCGGKPIETAGMIYIAAESGGKSVEPTKALQYRFPRSEGKPGFLFFEGERKDDYSINWKLPQAAKQPGVAPVAAAPRNAKGIELRDTLPTGRFYGNIVSSVLGGDSATINQYLKVIEPRMIDTLFNADITVSLEAIRNAKVDMKVSTTGRIESVKTSFTDKNTELDRQLKKFIFSVFPARFNAAAQATSISMTFGALEENETVRDGGGFNWVSQEKNGVDVWQNPIPDWGGDMTADVSLDKMVMSSTKLGWVNCDRFMNSQTVNFTVNTQPETNVRLVMKKYKAYFVNEYYGEDKLSAKAAGNYNFYKVPANEDVTAICTRKVDGKIYLAIADGKTGQGKALNISDYKEVSEAQLRDAIKQLNF